MSSKRGGDASFMLGLVLGMAIGAAVALVLTPDSGEGNRARIAGKVGETKGTLEERARTLRDETEDKLRSAASSAEDRARSVVSTTERKADDIEDRVEGAAEGAH